MNKKTIILLIGVILLFFVLIKIVVAQLCAPTPDNPLVNAVANVIPAPAKSAAKANPDPLSWEPAINQLLSFFSKACS